LITFIKKYNVALHSFIHPRTIIDIDLYLSTTSIDGRRAVHISSQYEEKKLLGASDGYQDVRLIGEALKAPVKAGKE